MPPNSLPNLEKKLLAAWPVDKWRQERVLIAVSGGADSIALLRAVAAVCNVQPNHLTVAHFNHALRGAASNADQTFVERLCGQFDLPCFCGRADANLNQAGSGEGLEGAARQARYDFLRQTAQNCGARYVALAHTADDQVETILHNIIRGTGPAGLAGMSHARPLTPLVSLVRPLLRVTRAEVLDYLKSLGQEYREDATNSLSCYTRNRLRLRLLPLLREEYNPRVGEAIIRLGALAAESQAALRPLVKQLTEQRVRFFGNDVQVNVRGLQSENCYVVREMLIAIWKQQGWPLQAMTYEHWTELAALANSATLTAKASASRRTLPGGVEAELRDATLHLTEPA